MTATNPPVSPGVGARRKGPKSLPTLPLSAFSAPNTGISESFPLPPSPSTVHPDRVVDASVRGSILEWKEQTSGALGGRIRAIIVKASDSELEAFVVSLPFFPLVDRDALSLESQASEAGVDVLAVSIPFDLESGSIPSIPTTKYPVTFTTPFDNASDPAVAALRAALTAGHTVEIDVQGYGDEEWEKLEDFLTKATADRISTGLVILCAC